MKIRLSGGVVASELSAWAARPAGPARLRDEAGARPGEPVALGPQDAADQDAEHAVAELARLVQAGGAVAAGAGVDLGAGFRSARLDGARGDQRDAVLAALRVLGLPGAGRLGNRFVAGGVGGRPPTGDRFVAGGVGGRPPTGNKTGFLVALFGPAVTRRVGAAAARAVEEGRWAALHLAVAASDVLGPEQLERVLALEAPPGVQDTDIVPGGLPSVLGRQLRQVLGPVPRPRRLDLILDLWGRVLDHHAARARRERRLATQSNRDRAPDLRKRRRHDDDEHVVARLKTSLGVKDPSLADAARWTPDKDYRRERLRRILRDALGATALLRTAVAVADHGLRDGLERSAPLLGAAASLVHTRAATHSARRVPGLTGIPSRPAAHVRDLHRKLSGDAPRDDAKFAAYVRPRLTSARAYALLIIEDLGQIMDDMLGSHDELLREWAATGLPDWRQAAGYGRAPAEWAGIRPWSERILRDPRPLYARLAPGQEPADVEVVGDLLWYADLVDALARLHGHDRARGVLGFGEPWLDHDPEPVAEPLAPRTDSVPGAVSGAAQLAALGGVPPRKARTWADLTAGLMSGTAIAAALTGDFAVPAGLDALDGAAVPGAGVRVKVARSARDLAEWSDHMGNCIAAPYYIDYAGDGRIGLVGLYDEHGMLVVNAELSPLRPAPRGWRVSEIAARFNADPDEAIERRFRAWVAALPGDAEEEPAPGVAGRVPDELPPARPARRRAAPRLVEDAGPALGTLARRAWDDTAPEVLDVYAAVAATPPDAALVRLRRMGAAQLASAVRRALDAGPVDLTGLWEATANRPLAAALDALDPALRDRFDRLALLLEEPPLPKTLRRLIKLPDMADAYDLDLAGRRTRRAIGRLAAQDDPVIAHALARRATEPLLCALTVAVTCDTPDTALAPVTAPGETRVPGYPATALKDEDGPWPRALAAARELGADTARFWDEIAAHGLRVPASWLASGGWTALWSRAHSHRR